ncbi:unnamed protein product [Symbiodinium sp. CCMP2592]|nr:unnamed protein product [Symbiodinium sp. CCMP2592]
MLAGFPPCAFPGEKTQIAYRIFDLSEPTEHAGRLTEEIRRREEGKKKIEAELESLQASLATAREELAACRQTEQNAQEELLKVEGTCAVEELRVLRHQVSDLEDLCKAPSLSASARRLYNQEVSVLKHQQQTKCARYSIETASLEDIAAETIEGLQDGEVQKETAEDSMSEPEADYSSPVPNGSSELQGAEPTALSEDEVRQDDAQEVPEKPTPAWHILTHPRLADNDPRNPRAAPLASTCGARARTSLLLLASISIITNHKLFPHDVQWMAELGSLEPEIERACEVEDFDLAEELESRRKTLTQKLEDAEEELATLRRKLDETGSEKVEPAEEEPAQEEPAQEDTPGELEEKWEKAEVEVKEDVSTEEPRSEVPASACQQYVGEACAILRSRHVLNIGAREVQE